MGVREERWAGRRAGGREPPTLEADGAVQPELGDEGAGEPDEQLPSGHAHDRPGAGLEPEQEQLLHDQHTVHGALLGTPEGVGRSVRAFSRTDVDDHGEVVRHGEPPYLPRHPPG